MHPDTMRLIDRWVGIPLCFFASFWPLKKPQADSNSTLSTNISHPDTIVFNWTDITIFLSHTGFFMSLFWKKLSEQPILPDSDPRVEDSIKGKY